MKINLALVILMLAGTIIYAVWRHETATVPAISFLLPLLLFIALEILVPKKMHYLHLVGTFIYPVMVFRPGQEKIIAVYYSLFIIALVLCVWANCVIEVSEKTKKPA